MPIWFTSQSKQTIIDKLLQDKENLILCRMEHDAQIALIDKKLEYFQKQQAVSEDSSQSELIPTR